MLQREGTPFSASEKPKDPDLDLGAVNTFPRQLGPEDMQESARGGVDTGKRLQPREQHMQRSCSGMERGAFWEVRSSTWQKRREGREKRR